jgi:hypothetical protein
VKFPGCARLPGSGSAAASQPPDPAIGGDSVLVPRPRDPSRSPQPTLIKDQKYTVGFENTFAAREDRALPVHGLRNRLG